MVAVLTFVFFLFIFHHVLIVVILVPTGSADETKETVEQLDGAQDDLNGTRSYQHREKVDIELHHIGRCHTRVPYFWVEEVVVIVLFNQWVIKWATPDQGGIGGG